VDAPQEVIMFHRSISLAAVAAVSVVWSVQAETLEPIQGKSIDLGTLTGITYYTVEPEGFRVVATLLPRGTDVPVRFVATLAPGQSVTLSTPRDVGEPPVQVRLIRQGEQLFVDGGMGVSASITESSQRNRP
jgi:hypothetical protein